MTMGIASLAYPGDGRLLFRHKKTWICIRTHDCACIMYECIHMYIYLFLYAYMHACVYQEVNA